MGTATNFWPTPSCYSDKSMCLSVPTSGATCGGPPDPCATPPAAPSGVSALYDAQSDAVVVSWSAVSGATSYAVTEYASCSGTPISSPAFVAGTSTSVAGVVDGETYYFKVQAVSADGCTSSNSACAYMTVQKPAPVESGTFRYYAWDHLGTIRLITDETGAKESDHAYEPYGLEIPPVINPGANTHQFTGHERDLVTGLDYMHYRFYGSNMGRFMKPDDVLGKPSDPQSWNLYSYVKGNPVNGNDPTGHDIEMIHRFPHGDAGHIILRVVDHNTGQVKATWSFAPGSPAKGVGSLVSGVYVKGVQTANVEKYLQEHKTESATLATSPKTDAALAKKIEERKTYQEEYQTGSNNCGTTAAELVHSVRPSMPTDSTTPGNVFFDFQKLVSDQEKAAKEAKSDDPPPDGQTGGKGPVSKEKIRQQEGQPTEEP